jgi:hypothetical protein
MFLYLVMLNWIQMTICSIVDIFWRYAQKQFSAQNLLIKLFCSRSAQKHYSAHRGRGWRVHMLFYAPAFLMAVKHNGFFWSGVWLTYIAFKESNRVIGRFSVMFLECCSLLHVSKTNLFLGIITVLHTIALHNRYLYTPGILENYVQLHIIYKVNSIFQVNQQLHMRLK